MHTQGAFDRNNRRKQKKHSWAPSTRKLARMSMPSYGVFYPLTASNHPSAYDPLHETAKGVSLVADVPNHAHLAYTRVLPEEADEGLEA